MKEGKLYFFDYPDPHRPIECKYVTSIDGINNYHVKKEDALLYFFDKGVTTYQFLTKKEENYKKNAKIMTYELVQIENRVGTLLYDYEHYVDENNNVKKRKAFVWRFVGFGRSCFAPTKEELIDLVRKQIHEYQNDSDGRGYNTYPYYTRHFRPKKEVGVGMDFVAFDFETANRNRHSICSVGMVFVENGVILDSIYELINPEEEFDSYNTLIHGIRESDVANALTFPVFYEKIKSRIENKLLIAHNMAFDGYALRDNLRRYGITPVHHDLLCSYQLSKRLVPNLPSYGIKPLCQHFQLSLNQHHHALDDAKACAELMMCLIKNYELHSLDAVYEKTSIKPGKVSLENYFSPAVSRNGEKLDLRSIEVSNEADPEHPLFGKNVVFTGKLSVFSRREAAVLVGKKGGTPQNGINNQTDYIVLGDFEDVMIKGNKSSKLIKAEKMINEGINIEIVSEQDFLKML